MRWLQRIVDKFVEWSQPEHKFVNVVEFPENVNEKTIYIVGESIQPWLLAFNCPCGCHSIIQLDLLKDTDPCWKYKVTKKKKINISPSIWRTSGCKSHFFVRKSKIDWA
ncbi:MAG: hypothetical protein JNL75_05910 [Chitinophagales bacterium]|nr:hypothetical protein [Chitinophagales bacterium]